jgi:hypothetical protein
MKIVRCIYPAWEKENEMNNTNNTRTGRQMAALSLAIALILGLLAIPLIGSASGVRQSQRNGPRSMIIPAGGTVTLQVRGFCLDFGKPFPTGEMRADGIADNKLRAALSYAVNAGQAEKNPQQVELAVWFLRDNAWHAPEHTIAQEIVDIGVALPNDKSDGIPLNEAIAQNKASATGKFVPQTKDNFYGDGDVEIKNLTNAELKVFMLMGQVFTATAEGDFQDLMTFELGTESVEVQGTLVPIQTIAASPTITMQPTVHPTLTAMLTPEAPTSQPQPTTETPANVSATSTNSSDLPSLGVADNTALLFISLAFIAALALIIAGTALKSRQH